LAKIFVYSAQLAHIKMNKVNHHANYVNKARFLIQQIKLLTAHATNVFLGHIKMIKGKVTVLIVRWANFHNMMAKQHVRNVRLECTKIRQNRLFALNVSRALTRTQKGRPNVKNVQQENISPYLSKHQKIRANNAFQEQHKINRDQLPVLTALKVHTNLSMVNLIAYCASQECIKINPNLNNVLNVCPELTKMKVVNHCAKIVKWALIKICTSKLHAKNACLELIKRKKVQQNATNAKLDNISLYLNKLNAFNVHGGSIPIAQNHLNVKPVDLVSFKMT